MKNRVIPWDKMRQEYIFTSATIRSLAAKYGCSKRAVDRRSVTEGWVALRKNEMTSVGQEAHARIREAAIQDRIRVLSTAVEWQVIVVNPCERVKAPRQIKKKIHYLEIDEVQKLIEAVLQLKDVRVQTAVMIFLFTGIRKGELSALEWKDIDLENQTMIIERNMQYIRGQGLVTASTKTESGERILSISTSIINQLKKYRAWQNEIRLKAGSQWVERDRLFTRWNGDYIAPSTAYHWVKHFLIDQGHAEMTVHGLRHTNISVLLSQGVDLITTCRRAGHSRPSTTANIYAHALRKPDEMAAGILEGILSKNGATGS